MKSMVCVCVCVCAFVLERVCGREPPGKRGGATRLNNAYSTVLLSRNEDKKKKKMISMMTFFFFVQKLRSLTTQNEYYCNDPADTLTHA